MSIGLLTLFSLFFLTLGYRFKHTEVSCNKCNDVCEAVQTFNTFAEFTFNRWTLNETAVLECTHYARYTTLVGCDVESAQNKVFMKCLFNNLDDLEKYLKAPNLTKEMPLILGETTEKTLVRKKDSSEAAKAYKLTNQIAWVLASIITIGILIFAAYLIVRRVRSARRNNKKNMMSVALAQSHVLNVVEDHNDRADTPPAESKGTAAGSATTTEIKASSVASRSDPIKMKI